MKNTKKKDGILQMNKKRLKRGEGKLKTRTDVMVNTQRD
jgi:hypothetical protein